MLRLLQIAIAAGILLSPFSTDVLAQSQTTGRIAGSVSDPTDAFPWKQKGKIEAAEYCEGCVAADENIQYCR